VVMYVMYTCLFFFFQAEDGIRDWSVTGVQTCALPISLVRIAAIHGRALRRRIGRAARCEGQIPALAPVTADEGCERRAFLPGEEIGRASCRERGEISGLGVSVKKKRE